MTVLERTGSVTGPPGVSVPGRSGPPGSAPAAASFTHRLWAWVDEAYLRPGTKPFAIVLDTTVLLVLLSLVIMVLETIPALDERFHTLFFTLECAIVLCFTIDYVISVVIRPDRWGYVFGFWGIIDLLAILPFFISFTNVAGMGRTLRALRALRTLRVLKLARLASAAAETVEEAQPSAWRDFQFALIGACTILVLVQLLANWHADQVFWLLVGIVAAANVAARRWCVRTERQALGTLLIYGVLLAGVTMAILLDAAGESGRGGTIALVAVVFTTITAFMVEVPAGAL